MFLLSDVAGLSRNSKLRFFWAFLLSFFFICFYSVGVFEPLEMYGLKFRLLARKPVAAPQEIVIVSVDDSTFRELELSYLNSLPRSFHTELIYKLKEIGVERIAFDFVFRDWAVNEENQKLVEAFASTGTVIGQDRYIRTRRNLKGKLEAYEELMIPADDFANAATEVASIRFFTVFDGGMVRKFSPFFDKDSETGRSLAAAGIDLQLSPERLPTKDALINFYGRVQLFSQSRYSRCLRKMLQN